MPVRAPREDQQGYGGGHNQVDHGLLLQQNVRNSTARDDIFQGFFHNEEYGRPTTEELVT